MTSLIISDDFKIKKAMNTEALYSLVNLKAFSCSQNLKLDFSFLIHLKTLTLKYSRNFSNLNQLKLVEQLSLRSFNEEDCTLISEMENIQSLKLQGSYTSLEGILQLKNLELLRLIHSSKIFDISEINELEKLSSLYIEKCKRLLNFDFLKRNNSMEELFISELDSLSFIPTMKKLKTISFWNVKDGNLEPLLNSLTLKNIYFYPNRKFYNYKLQDILSRLTLQ
ncbi:toxin [Listeria farberi]|uniref:Toxin n=1 Tax=Listeria farberi TaxID=2713500 RepID=A0A7X0ZG99_9LIST|nr:toxin [Listeria farberi]MBC2286648.1 toxin [Listeria farberi]